MLVCLLIRSKMQFSLMPDAINECDCAHSQEELDERRYRYEWFQLKREQARHAGLYSYMAAVLEDYKRAGEHKLEALSEQLPSGVQLSCTRDLLTRSADKNAEHSWFFTVFVISITLYCTVVKIYFHVERYSHMLNATGNHSYSFTDINYTNILC